jgi:hypothetical protein
MAALSPSTTMRVGSALAVRGGEVVFGGVAEGFVGGDVGEVPRGAGLRPEGAEAADDAFGGVFEVEVEHGLADFEGLFAGEEGDPGLAGFGFADQSVDFAGVEDAVAVVAGEDGGRLMLVVGLAVEDGLERDGPPGGVFGVRRRGAVRGRAGWLRRCR